MNNINPRLVTLVCSGTTTTTLFFCFLLSLCPLVFSQLPADQTRTMNELSEHFNKTVTGWNVADPCRWEGVSCKDSVGITDLALSGFDPSDSSFLRVVCKLPSLQSLDVSNNRLSSIPDEFMRSCGRLDGLRLLNFSRNLLIGPLPSFNGFVGLESLDFSFNKLNGDISLLLDELINLKTLNLSRNAFEGSFPTNLGKSKTLEQLELSINRLHGQIPEEIADYRNLKLIDLNGNNLSGSIPYRIGELAKLEFLILSSNNLIGEIPASLSNISTLSRFAANQNNFHGKIPDGITRYVKNLDLSYNRLIGPIPPDLLSPSTLQSVDLSYNWLEGSIPGSICSGLVRLRLGSNLLNGTIPSANYATLLKLTYLELDNNSLSGKIPRELGDCKTLTLLNLAQNKLSGSLPEELGNLHNLQVMKLQLNNLTGEIPSQFGQLPMLSQLNISCNNLSGPIPPSISNLQKLANLNLQRNSLSGSIPSSITNMTFLLELQLGDNQLRGEIPLMPLKLQIALNLSSNLFEGTIPETLSRLTGLEVLDLSNNKFSGNIPDALAQMTALTQLILSNNQLSGVGPKFNSWVLLNASGNPGLTFPPPSPPNTSLASVKRKKSVVVPIIIALVAAVVAVGGVTVIALSISRRIYRVNDEQLQSQEDPPFPQVIQGNLLTANGIHKSNISFSKAMEAVADPLNIVLKTRFSTYYKAIMPSGMSYLIKKLNWSNKIFQLGSHDKFDQELEVLGKLSNSNVMTPLAYVLSADSAYLFYECAPKGNLFDVLHDNGGNALDWQSRYSIAVGVAQGLAFLHGWTSSPILLLDLSSKSIMLKSLKEPQVGEIELCKVIDPTKSTGSLSTVAGSVGYIPPEYAYTMRVTMAGNVYSFGVILLELLTGKPAVSEGAELAKLVLRKAQHDKWDRILDFSVSRTSLHVRSQMLAVLKVALACVSVSPEARPNMKSVLRMLLNAR